jgi:hypothetical protein
MGNYESLLSEARQVKRAQQTRQQNRVKFWHIANTTMMRLDSSLGGIPHKTWKEMKRQKKWTNEREAHLVHLGARYDLELSREVFVLLFTLGTFLSLVFILPAIFLPGAPLFIWIAGFLFLGVAIWTLAFCAARTYEFTQFKRKYHS